MIAKGACLLVLVSLLGYCHALLIPRFSFSGLGQPVTSDYSYETRTYQQQVRNTPRVVTEHVCFPRSTTSTFKTLINLANATWLIMIPGWKAGLSSFILAMKEISRGFAITLSVRLTIITVFLVNNC